MCLTLSNSVAIMTHTFKKSIGVAMHSEQFLTEIDKLSFENVEKIYLSKKSRLDKMREEFSSLSAQVLMLENILNYKYHMQIVPTLNAGGRIPSQAVMKLVEKKITIAGAAYIILQRSKKPVKNNSLAQTMLQEYNMPKGTNPANTLYGVLWKHPDFVKKKGGFWELAKWEEANTEAE